MPSDLVRIYAEAEQRLKLLVEQSFRSGAIGSEAYRRRQLLHVQVLLEQLRQDGRIHGGALTRSTYSAAAVATDRVMGLSGDFGGVHTRAVDVLAGGLTQRLDEAAATVGRRVQDAFRRAALEETAIGVAAGQARREVSQALEQRLLTDRVTDALTGFVDRSGRRWPLSTYTEMVARTTTREAVTAGTANRLQEHGVDLVEISEHPDPADICKPYAGRTFSLTGDSVRYPTLDRVPPFHPNAVMAGTEVEAIGELQGGCRAQWSGPVRHLATHGGVVLTVGPNHPVLTARGWVPAQLLREGDYLIRRVDRERMSAATGAPVLSRRLRSYDDLENGPALAEEIFDALAATGLATRVAAAPTQLHGDGNFCQGEVDVVRAHGQLADVADPALVEPGGELVFEMAGPEHPRLAGPSDRGVMRRGVRLAVGRALSDLDVPPLETSAERRFAEWPAFGEVLHRLAGQVTVDELVEIRDVDDWRGHAFDFETSSSMYFAAGVVVHNCRHVLTPAGSNFERFERELRKAEKEDPVV